MTVRIALGQFNAVVGDLAGNAQQMRGLYEKAIAAGADLVVFPELALCGYPPEDLVFKRHFVEDNRKTVEKLARDCAEKTVIVGFVDYRGGKCFNSAAVLQKGRIARVYHKGLLPNTGVFDEQRNFQAGRKPLSIAINDIKIAVTICADIWDLKWLTGFLRSAGKFQMMLNISASPFHLGKIKERTNVISKCARNFDAGLCYCNLVGGQDELIFDGRSMFADSRGKVVAQAKAFEDDLLIADVNAVKRKVEITPARPPAVQPADDIEEMYHALVLGTRDYTRKNGFQKVILGLSGGIDSSVVAAVAVAALGTENVIGVTMPSKFNSPETIADAKKLADNLGIAFLTIPIEAVLAQFDAALKAFGGWNSKGLAYENLQARIRGSILMSISNQSGCLVLTTGNKSETAVGYATLYGDTAGGFAVIKDVPKTLVYKLADYINKKACRKVIPQDVIVRPPTAELRPNQKDTDSLPEYDLLDRILKGYVEEDKSPRELVKAGLPKDVVRKVIRMIDRNEYKRRQSPPGIKITPKAFGKDRRLPITNRYAATEDLQ